MGELWYPLECVLAPGAIGVAMYLGFELWERRWRRTRPQESLPVIDYLI